MIRQGEAVFIDSGAPLEPRVLKATEPLAFELSLGLAQLEANPSAEAIKLFKDLASKGNRPSTAWSGSSRRT